MAYFTKNVYNIGIFAITAFGDNLPLVGHNAFIRTKSLISCATKILIYIQ